MFSATDVLGRVLYCWEHRVSPARFTKIQREKLSKLLLSTLRDPDLAMMLEGKGETKRGLRMCRDGKK
jgi:hypothetical protein